MDEHTAEATKQNIPSTRIGEHVVKGIEQPVAVYKPSSDSSGLESSRHADQYRLNQQMTGKRDRKSTFLSSDPPLEQAELKSQSKTDLTLDECPAPRFAIADDNSTSQKFQKRNESAGDTSRNNSSS